MPQGDRCGSRPADHDRRARTAPKGKGIDLIEIVAVTGETIEALAEATRLASEQTGMKFFLRDAENIRQADAVILVGTRLQSLSLNCGYCGYPTCEKKNGHPAAPCALNMVDLGIAIGSMTAKAADLRVDNRVMFSAGKAARTSDCSPDATRSTPFR